MSCGAILGCTIVSFYYYGKGLFAVESQDESTFILVIATIYRCLGITIYCATGCLCSLSITLVLKQKSRQEKKLRIINSLKFVPFSNLAFDSTITCSICLENFSREDKVIQLKCHKTHIFHDECAKLWFKTELKCPLCKKKITS